MTMVRWAAALIVLWVGCREPEALGPVPAPPAPAEPSNPNTFLPFDPLDEDATFTATLLVEDRDGDHPAASLEYAGQTYTSDADGKLVVPNVKVRDPQGLQLRAEGYLARSVLLEYSRTGGDGMRVVLERPGVVREFASDEPASVVHGSVQLEFAAGTFAREDGTPYEGTVRVAAFGLDPVASVITMDEDGLALRPDFDLDRIPQGYGLAVDDFGLARFVIPESVFTVDMTDPEGAPLQLQAGSQATYRFKLSAITTRQEGDSLQTYRFDEAQQRWVQGGTCKVQSTPDGALECVGATDQFSSWMISSGANQTTPSCGNYRFRVKADSTYETTPVSIELTDVYGRDSREASMARDTGAPPAMRSTSGTCFFQAQPFAFVRVRVKLRRVASNVEDTFLYVLGKGASTEHPYDHNLQLVRTGELTNSDLTVAKLDANCLTCPPTVIDLDLRSREPAESFDPCAEASCGPGAACVGAGTCTCADGLRYGGEERGCVTPSCEAPLYWDSTQSACAKPDPCMENNGGCPADAICRSSPDYEPVCSCKPGFAGDGTTCTQITRCADAPCRNGGECENTDGGYTCSCPEGWSGDNCENDLNECTAAAAPCDENATCTNTADSFTCACKPGYAGSGSPGSCSNVDACAAHPCGSGYTCADLPPPALGTANGRTCTDVNECATNGGGCGEHSTCQNTPGSFTCGCQAGYVREQGACVDVDACEDHPCESIQTCTDLPAPAPNDASGRTCSPATGEIDACINYPCSLGETCEDIPGGPDSEEGRTCSPSSEVDACINYPCSLGETCEDIPGGPDSEEGRTCSPSGPTSTEADLTSGTSGTTSAQDFDNKTRGVEVEYLGFSSMFLDGVRIEGLNGQTEAYVRVYDSSQQLVASGMNTTVTGDSAEILLTQSYLVSMEPLRIAIWLFDGAGTATVFEPASFPYDESGGNFSITGAFEATGDNAPTTASDFVPQMTLLLAPL